MKNANESRNVRQKGVNHTFSSLANYNAAGVLCSARPGLRRKAAVYGKKVRHTFGNDRKQYQLLPEFL